MTTEELSKFLREAPESLRIEGIVETDDTRYLGAIGLQKQQPIFSSILGFPFNGFLSDSARFYVRAIRATDEGRDGVAVIFRQFDSSKYQATPEELFAGWGPPDAAGKLEAWVADMNSQLQALLALKRRSST